MLKVIAIYRITSPTGRIYIGQSRDVRSRFTSYRRLACKDQPRLYASLSKYGAKNHSFEIIEECSLISLNEREIFWGLFYKTLGKRGLNLALGNSQMIMSETQKQKLSKITKKRFESVELRLSMSLVTTKRMKLDKYRNQFAKKVSKYDLNGSFITSYVSVSNAAKSVKGTQNKIGLVCSGKRLSAYGFVWRYSNDPFNKFNSESKCRPVKRPINCYNLKGKLKASYTSATEVQRLTGIPRTEIRRACNGVYKTLRKSIWKYA